MSAYQIVTDQKLADTARIILFNFRMVLKEFDNRGYDPHFVTFDKRLLETQFQRALSEIETLKFVKTKTERTEV